MTRAPKPESQMHPLGTYLAITDSNREHGSTARYERRVTFAPVDATPIPEPEPEERSRITRLAAVVRRRVVRTAGT
jgi:hypothetical protein